MSTPMSWADYLAQQQAAFQPQARAGRNPFNAQGLEQSSSFDPGAALREYAATGGQVSMQDWLRSASAYRQPTLYEPPEGGDKSYDYSEADRQQIEQWLGAYRPEYAEQGYTVNSDFAYGDGYGTLVKDLGDTIEYRPLNRDDGTLGDPIYKQDRSASGLGKILKVAAPIALSVFGAPALAGAFGGGLGATVGAGAITGAAGSAITGGNILKGAALGGIGGGIGYGIRDAGLFNNLTDAAGGVEYDPSVFADTPANTPFTDPFKGISGYDPNGLGGMPRLDGLPADLANSPFNDITGFNPAGFSGGLSGVPFGEGLTTGGGPADRTPVGSSADRDILDRIRQGGQDATDWLKANPLAGRALMSAGGALLNSVGGGSSGSGGSSYRDDGYRPTIRTGWQPRIAATQAPTPQRPPMQGLISLPTTGQANDGLWRYGLLGPGR